MEEISGEIKPSANEKEIEKGKSKIKNFFLGWVKDNYDKIFIGILILAFIIRLWIFFKTMNQPFWWDEADYLSAAKNWGLGLDIRDVWYYRRGFLFPLIGALIFRLGLGEIGMRFLVVLFSTGIVAVSYFIISKMFNKKLALITSLVLSLSWILLFFTGRVLTDIPAAFFALLSLLFFWKGYVLKEGNKFLYLFGLFLALAVLTRMQSFMFIPPFLIFILIREKSKIFKNKHLWITLGIFLLLLVPQFVLYSMHYGNAFNDLAAHYLGIGASSNSTYAGDQRAFSLETFNYFANLPYMLSTIIFGLLIIGAIYFFTDLFIGIDKIFKNEILQKKLFVLMWVLSLFLIMGYIGSVSYVEQRYITAGLPFLFMIAVFPIIFVSDFLMKQNKLKKIIPGILFIVLIALMIPNLILSNSLLNQQADSYSQVKKVGELMKSDSNTRDIIMSTSLPQITYYSERSTYPYDIQHDGVAKGDKSLLNYSDGQKGFEEFLKNKQPKYLMASVFETDPDWILKKGTYNEDNYIILPFFNSSMSYNSQGQITSLDLNQEVKKDGMTLTLFYPKTSGQINGIFIYKVEYS